MAHNTIMKFHRPRDLKNTETSDSLDHWINQFTVYIQRDPLMAPFLTGQWNSAADNMGFTAGPNAAADALSPAEQAANCKIFLAHLASFMEVPYHRTAIEKRTTSLASVWALLRKIYNVEKSAESFLDIGMITYSKSESYLSFYYRILYYVENNLADANITVDTISTGGTGDKLTVSLMDMAALLWLEKLDRRLLDRVKIDYSVRIKNGDRLSQLVPTIAKALPGMIKNLDNLKREIVNYISNMNLGQEEDDDDTNIINRISTDRRGGRRGGGRGNTRGASRGSFNLPNNGLRQTRDQGPKCAHCTWLKEKLGIREVDNSHPTSSCNRSIPPQIRAIVDNSTYEEEPSEEDETEESQGEIILDKETSKHPHFQTTDSRDSGTQPPDKKAQDKLRERFTTPPLSDLKLKRLRVRTLRLTQKAKSPRIEVTHSGRKISALLDEGSELDCMDGTFAADNEIRLASTTSSAIAAGNQRLNILGITEDEIIVDTLFQSLHVPINLGRMTVIKDLGTSLLIGEPGKSRNGISTDPMKRVVFLDRHGKRFQKPYHELDTKSNQICRISDGPRTIFPDESLIIQIPEALRNQNLLITPRREFAGVFKPKMIEAGSTISLENISPFPVNIRKYSHVADIKPTSTVEADDKVRAVHLNTLDNFKYTPLAKDPSPPSLEDIKVDPDNVLSPEMRNKFHEVNWKYKDVFTKSPGKYTGAFGDVDTSIKFNAKPVQTRKVSVPSYSMEMQQILGQEMDKLIREGVLVRAEDIGVSIEFMSPIFLVPKEGGGWRIVVDFTFLNRFISRDNSVSPTIQEAKSALAQKKYFIELDLSAYFHQGGLRREDCAFLGVQHPFLGPYVYSASPQGLKNSSEQSYSRLAVIFGPMIQQNKLTRMADGLYVLADSPGELLDNYIETLERAHVSGLTIKPSKVSICPRSTVLFGWKLEDGKWSPQNHVLSSLTRADKPNTVKQMRSFIGAVKQLSETIRSYSSLLHPLEKVVGSRSSSEKLSWTEEMETAFSNIKAALQKTDGIHFPRKTDRLVTSSDFSKHSGAIGGMLTIIRKKPDGKEVKLLGGHYSAQIGSGRSSWLPCDGESFAVKKVLEHFRHFLIENENESTHLTDSMPVVMAWKRLTTGRFSTSPKISAFLSALASLPVRIEHRPGSHLLLSDHSSRHPPPPCEGKCDICKFVNEDARIGDQISIFSLTDDDRCPDIEMDLDSVPYLQLNTWKQEQMQDPVHSKLMALIKNGQAPDKKRTGGTNTLLKHLHTLFLKNNLRIHKGVFMVKTKQGHYDGYAISVPTSIFHGLAYMFHTKLQHPTKSQLVRFLSRYFYVSALPAIVEEITDSCLSCLSTKRLPKALLPQSTTIPKGFGTNYSGDVLERHGQAIYICKESFSQFVTATIAPDQTSNSLRDAILTSVSPTINLSGATLRLDSAPAFQSLSKSCQTDPIFRAFKLGIELSQPLNKNGNPAAESTVAEVKRELLHIADKDQNVSPSMLALAVHNVNSRIRSNGRTAWENLTARDSLTGSPIKLSDSSDITELAKRRELQHERNTRNRSKTKITVPFVKYNKGDIVMFRDMNTLDTPRDTFVVVEDNGNEVEIRKLKRQMRLRTYKVKREQIILVFSATSATTTKERTPPSPAHPVDPEKNPTPKMTDRPRRLAAKRSEMRTHQMASEKVISIRSRKRRKEENAVYILYSSPTLPNRDPHHDEDRIIPPYFFNLETEETDNAEDEIHPNHEAEANSSMEGMYPSSQSDSDLYISINQSPHDYGTTNTSHSSNKPEDESHDNVSLDWDANSLTVNLSDPLQHSVIFPPSSQSDHDEVFDDLIVPPSPTSADLIPPNTANLPLSPLTRITRSLLRSGLTDTSESSSNHPGSPFLRSNPRRQHLTRVRFQDDDISPILSPESQRRRRIAQARVAAAHSRQ